MAEIAAPRRRGALDGLSLPAKDGVAMVSDAGAALRFIYRGAPELFPAPFGVELPTAPLRANTRDSRSALWLGPDEWLLLAPADQQAALQTVLDTLHERPASLVDVGHRQVGLIVAGPRARELLNAGCPLDLEGEAFPAGMCTRTLLGKAEIVLWRTADETFHLEVARSIVPYVVAFLHEAMFGVA